MERGRDIDFLGYCFSRNNVRLRKSVKQNFARKYKRAKSETRRVSIRGSYKGWCKWGNCKNLYKNITTMGFKEAGVVADQGMRDGKRFFKDAKVKLVNILNVPITVIDFESGITTENGPDRYVVRIILNGEHRKFTTSAFELKATLDRARELEGQGRKIFPVKNVTIKVRATDDNKQIYYFD